MKVLFRFLAIYFLSCCLSEAYAGSKQMSPTGVFFIKTDTGTNPHEASILEIWLNNNTHQIESSTYTTITGLWSPIVQLSSGHGEASNPVLVLQEDLNRAAAIWVETTSTGGIFVYNVFGSFFNNHNPDAWDPRPSTPISSDPGGADVFPEDLSLTVFNNGQLGSQNVSSFVASWSEIKGGNRVIRVAVAPIELTFTGLLPTSWISAGTVPPS